MKKILIFSLSYYPKHIGGAEVAIKEITDRIDPSEIEFHLICNRYDSTLPRIEQVGNVTVHRIGIATENPIMADLRRLPLHLNKVLFQFLAFFKARELHRTYRFDGIWAMMAHATGVPAGLMKTFFPEVTYILTLQEGDPPAQIERTMRWFGPLFRRAFSKADALQAISTFLATWGKRMGATCPIEVIPNAVDAARFSVRLSDEARAEVRSALGTGVNDTLMVTTSRLVHKNAIDDVIRALVHLPTTVRFAVFGTGPDEEALRSLARECGVANRVDFRGHADHDDLPRYLAASDIFIRPSRSEGMGNSFIEAMSASVPVIATQEGGIADFLFDAVRNPERESTGWAVDADSPLQIAAAVGHIMAHPEEVRTVTVRARAMVVEQYDWETVVRAMRERVFARVPEGA